MVEVLVTYSVEVRRRAFELLAQGVSPAKAAAAVGVSRQSVSGWRSQVGGVMRQPTAECGRYLDRCERYEIARLREAGWSIRSIAGQLGRAPSTIGRELRRRGSGWGYQPERAHQLALVARRRPKVRKLVRLPQLGWWVQERLDERYSPEQVAGRLRVEFSDDSQMRISHEAIYQAIYVHPRGELKRQLRAHLRTGRTGRRRRSTRQPRGAIIDPVSIHDRPVEVEGRLVPGHYEGDLIVGPKGSVAAIATLVERASGHLTLFGTDRSAAAATAGLTRVVNSAEWPICSLTWDRGSELAQHREFTTMTGIQVYFADPYAPWQRGSNENSNGLLREYFPKGTDLARYTAAEIQAAADQLNNRPRKRHGFRTPNEVIAEMINTDRYSRVATIP
jgi:transposase, IS30 family